MTTEQRKHLLTGLLEKTLSKKLDWETNNNKTSFIVSFARSSIILSLIENDDPFEGPSRTYSLKIASDEGVIVESLSPNDFSDVIEDPLKTFDTLFATIQDQLFRITETVQDVLNNLKGSRTGQST